MKTIEAHEVALSKVFSSDYSFTIPTFQRPYAWKVEQTLQLLDDLEDSLGGGSAESYFLGSIVLVRRDEPSAYDVIDGQQRLTTLTILLSVLRGLSTQSDVVGDIDELLREKGSTLTNKAARPRLAIRPRDTDFFRAYVQEKGQIPALLAVKPESLKTDAQRAVVKNATALHNKLVKWDEDKRLLLLKRMIQRTYLVVVSTEDIDSAYRIFSVMNARGLPLSAADIFKSSVVGALPETEADAYGVKWDDAEQQLGNTAFSELFQHVRMIYAKDRGRQNLLREFPEQVLNQFLPHNARAFVDEVLVPYANADSHIRNQNYQASAGAEAVNAWTTRLSMIDNNDWRPPALWMVKNHSDEPEQLAALLKRLERLAASMLVRHVYSTPRANKYAELLKQLDAGDGVDAVAFDLSDREKVETLQWLNGEVYLATSSRKYVLLRLDESLAGSSGVVYTHKILTVEHVLPQNPRSDSQWRKVFTDDQRELWTHRLANLVLLNRQKNSAASNEDFEKKKSGYFGGKNGVANFAVTTQVLSQPEWTPAVLEQRQKDLLKYLAAEWELT